LLKLLKYIEINRVLSSWPCAAADRLKNTLTYLNAAGCFRSKPINLVISLSTPSIEYLSRESRLRARSTGRYINPILIELLAELIILIFIISVSFFRI
jgi:hypothetical protein